MPMVRHALCALGIVLLLGAGVSRADGLFGDQGKLLLTAGFSSIEGAGGGALTPWALITGYGTSDSYGANAHYTDLELRDARLQSFGVAAGAFDRIEFSASRLDFDLRTPLGAFALSEDVYGAKLKLFGDAVKHALRWATACRTA
jgi:hypothetical protein